MGDAGIHTGLKSRVERPVTFNSYKKYHDTNSSNTKGQQTEECELDFILNGMRPTKDKTTTLLNFTL